MARILPDGWEALDETLPAARRSIATLRALRGGLDDAYHVYHGVHWSAVDEGFGVFDGVDFIVVNRAGDLLLIEQALGLLRETENGLVKALAGREQRLGPSLSRLRQRVLEKIAQRADLRAPQIEVLLYCPHHRVRMALTPGFAPGHVVDAARRDELPHAIATILPAGAAGDAQALRNLHRFLQDQLQLEADVGALIGRSRQMVTRVAGGLAAWAPRIECRPQRVRVRGGAGSGKTQLALTEFNAALAAGRRALYVCFNRPLADHFAAIAAPGGLACTFHGLCEQVLRAHGEAPDYSRPDGFAALVARAAELAVPETLRCDTLIVDEGQDWMPQWRDQVLRHAVADARCWWLEDPLQNLYGRPEVELPGWVGLSAAGNYRSSRPVMRFLRALMPQLDPGEARSPLDFGAVELLVYETPGALAAQVKLALKSCVAAGFARDDIALLSFHGRDSSALLGLPALGDFRLRGFSGRYDLFGAPEYSPGEIALESVLRFKGQSAPAVVLAELDFTALDEKALRRLFVGATRATMKLVLVAAPAAADLLRPALNGA